MASAIEVSIINHFKSGQVELARQMVVDHYSSTPYDPYIVRAYAEIKLRQGDRTACFAALKTYFDYLQSCPENVSRETFSIDVHGKIYTIENGLEARCAAAVGFAADNYLLLKKPKDAIPYLLFLVENGSKGHYSRIIELRECYRTTNQHEKALDCTKLAIELSDSHENMIRAVVDCLAAKMPEQAAKFIANYERNHNLTVDDCCSIASHYEEYGFYDEGHIFLNRVRHKFSTNPVLKCLHLISSLRLRNTSMALDILSDPNFDINDMKSGTHKFHVAMLLLRNQRVLENTNPVVKDRIDRILGAARERAKDFYARYPTPNKRKIYVDILCRGQKDFPAAIAFLRDEIRRRGPDPYLAGRLLYCMTMSGNSNEALTILGQLPARIQSHPDIQYQCAMALYNKGLYGQSMKCALAAIEIDPSVKFFYLLKSICSATDQPLIYNQKLADAIASLKISKDAAPKYKWENLPEPYQNFDEFDIEPPGHYAQSNINEFFEKTISPDGINGTAISVGGSSAWRRRTRA